MTAHGQKPAARELGALVVMAKGKHPRATDKRRNSLYLLGGQGNDGTAVTKDEGLWEYQLEEQSWDSPIVYQQDDIANLAFPPSRLGPGVVAKGHRMFLAGGSPLSNLTVLNIAKDGEVSWFAKELPSSVHAGRFGGGLVAGDDQYLYLMGGRATSGAGGPLPSFRIPISGIHSGSTATPTDTPTTPTTPQPS